jgi:N-acetylneuraminate synthase
MNLRTIPDLIGTFDTVVGLSDHSLGLAVAVTAVALGARVIEKHLTLSRADGGPDSAFSLEPDEFRATVDAVRCAERALGQVRYGPIEREEASLKFRRSLFVVEDIASGERFTSRNVRCIRPGYGLHPRHLDEVLERVATNPIVRGTPLTWDLVQTPKV